MQFYAAIARRKCFFLLMFMYFFLILPFFRSFCNIMNKPCWFSAVLHILTQVRFNMNESPCQKISLFSCEQSINGMNFRLLKKLAKIGFDIAIASIYTFHLIKHLRIFIHIMRLLKAVIHV